MQQAPMDSPSGTPSAKKKPVAKLSDHDGDADTLVNTVSGPQSKPSTAKSSEPTKVRSYYSYRCEHTDGKNSKFM